MILQTLVGKRPGPAPKKMRIRASIIDVFYGSFRGYQIIDGTGGGNNSLDDFLVNEATTYQPHVPPRPFA